MFKFGLGIKVKDILTGFTGLVMGRAEYYITDRRTYAVMPLAVTDRGRVPEWEWLDEDRLVDVPDQDTGQDAG